VTIVDISSGGARLQSAGRIKPGTRADLQIVDGHRRYLRGHIARSRVCCLIPLSYEAAMTFDEPFPATQRVDHAG
jgi:hypothetical protein